MAPEPKELVRVEVTPRFEIFYALQALESGAGIHLAEWRREMERRIPPRLRTTIASVAPSALIWPLLADSLRNEPLAISFAGIVSVLEKMSSSAFQQCVLGGVFKTRGSVDGLMTGKTSLRQTVLSEAGAQGKLLSLLGLHPFVRDSPSVLAFERIASDPAGYRNDVITVIQAFWNAGFSTTWAWLEPQMRRSAREMRETISRDGFAAFALDRKLPVSQKNATIVSASGATKVPLASTRAVHLIPSAFNTTKLWAAYSDSHRRTRFFIPVLDPSISPTVEAESRPVETSIEPAAIFRALGDTTRYAMASTIARSPMTSVELARAFGVSKPTISHHVQQLRSAGLLIETPGENGVTLSLNRRALERASSSAAREMFSDDATGDVIRRTRKPNS